MVSGGPIILMDHFLMLFSVGMADANGIGSLSISFISFTILFMEYVWEERVAKTLVRAVDFFFAGIKIIKNIYDEIDL